MVKLNNGITVKGLIKLLEGLPNKDALIVPRAYTLDTKLEVSIKASIGAEPDQYELEFYHNTY